MNSLRQHGQDVSHSLHGHSRALAALHGPHPALVQEVTGQGGQGGRGGAIGCHAEGHRAVGRLRKVLHVEDEGSPEVQRQLLIPAVCFIHIVLVTQKDTALLTYHCWTHQARTGRFPMIFK